MDGSLQGSSVHGILQARILEWVGDHAVSSSGMFTVSVGLVKSALFGLLVAMVSCHCGMRTESAADGVGRSATRSVVGSIVAVAVADGILAVVCYLWGW